MFACLQKTTFVGMVAVVMIGTGRWLLPGPNRDHGSSTEVLRTQLECRSACDELNQIVAEQWANAGITPAPPADPRIVARRLALGIVGTIPSLEEWRMWERWPTEDRIARWIEYLLADRRSSDYLPERLVRGYMGTEGGPVLVYRRRRFVMWLSDQIHGNRPYDELVSWLLTENGLWTSTPAVNFVTSTIGSGDEEGQPDPMQLATRSSRAFLGVRLDCVRCHDDRMGGDWTQADFHQLAAFFASARNSITGVRDVDKTYHVTYLNSDRNVDVPCHVPFAKELFDSDSSASRRQQLADWITHQDNEALARAFVNRLWDILLGRPLVQPVDDIPRNGPWPAPLTFLANDLRQHRYDVYRLVRLIANSEVFSLESQAPHALTMQHDALWACFPLLRLRPEQVAGAIQQAASLETLDADSHILNRWATFDGRREFIQRFSDAGDKELVPLHETSPQILLLMNGAIVAEKTEVDLFANAATRIAQLARDDDTAIRTLFLVMLSREPSPEEWSRYSARLSGVHGDSRSEIVCDLAWVLFNSSEFNWSH